MQVALSPIGKIVENYWNSLHEHFTNATTDAFVVMPNHLHGIMFLSEGEAFIPKSSVISRNLHQNNFASEASKANASPLQHPRGTKSNSIGAIIQNFKSVTTRRARQAGYVLQNTLWQRNYYEHIIRNERSLNMIRLYIELNPELWKTELKMSELDNLTLEEIDQLLAKYRNQIS